MIVINHIICLPVCWHWSNMWYHLTRELSSIFLTALIDECRKTKSKSRAGIHCLNRGFSILPACQIDGLDKLSENSQTCQALKWSELSRRASLWCFGPYMHWVRTLIFQLIFHLLHPALRNESIPVVRDHTCQPVNLRLFNPIAHLNLIAKEHQVSTARANY